MFPTTACCFSFAVLGRRLSQDWNDGVVGGGPETRPVKGDNRGNWTRWEIVPRRGLP